MKYFNSDLVSKYIIDKTLGITSKDRFLWENKKEESSNLRYNWPRRLLFSRVFTKKITLFTELKEDPQVQIQKELTIYLIV